ncbi:unnamed protein product [Clavelina lepadiformis]|uniref:Hydantoinase/oxoprolinase N-terminal domain-containing protein n=1 Tax=Clavelina lepadiformis TaxID=159417 RepID=A0ABP0G859_CLALP
MLHSLDMKNASPNFIIDIESIHCKCSRSSSQICQLTDLCVEVMKLLSVDPQNYCDAPREGIRSIMEKIDFIRMGTTVATSFLLERKDERMALALTESWRDPLGNQSRPKMLDLLLQGRDLTQRMKRYVTMNTRITVVQQNRGQYDLRQFL